jgi:hypothetical protein
VSESRQLAPHRSGGFDDGDRRVGVLEAEATPEAKRPEASYLPLVKAAPASLAHATRATQATQPVERIRRGDAEAPGITVTIGRVEVRAITAPALALAPAPARPAAAKTLSLEDYLDRRYGTAQR